MDFGMPTLIETRTLEECAALSRELDLQFIELNMNLPQYQPERIGVPCFAEIAEEYGIYYTIHLDENLNPFDFNERAAHAYTGTVLQTIEIAKRLSVPVLNMHFHQGVYFTLPDRKAYLFQEYPDEYRRKLEAFRDSCTAAVGRDNIKICIENTRAFQLDFAADGIDALLESPVFALTFDTGHDAAGGFRQFPAVERNLDRLYHMHLHDFSSSRGDHLPLGEGGLDIAGYLRLAQEHDCRVLLETKTVDGLRLSAERLRSLTAPAGRTASPATPPPGARPAGRRGCPAAGPR